MTSIGQVADNMNGISRLTSMHPAAFSNAWGTDYRDRYMMEMQTSPLHGTSSSLNNINGSTTTSGYHLHPSMKSAPLVWRQRQALESDDALMIPNHRIHLGDNNNNINNGSNRGVEGSSSRIPPSILGRSDSTNRDSHASSQSSSAKLFESNVGSVMTGDWQAFVDSDTARYSSLLPPMTASNSMLQQPPSSTGGGTNEGAMIRELIGKLGGSTTMGSSSTSSLLVSSPPSQHRAGGGEGGENLVVQKLGVAGNQCWNSGSNTMAVEIPASVGRGLTVDPSKGGLSLNHGAVVTAGIATSNCLAPFSADPGFAERAAKFSSFNNGNYARSFPSNSDTTGGAARMRSRSGVSPRSSGTLSPPPLLQESVGRVISNDTTASERFPDSRSREIQSGNRGVADDLVASATAVNKVDENSLEQNYVRDEGYIASKTASRTAGSLLRSARSDEEEGDEPQGASAATSADASSGIKRTISTFSPEQGISTFSPEQDDIVESPVETCASPGGRSVATDISVKKRKPSFEERPSNKLGASGSASSHHNDDAKTEETDEDVKAKRLRRGDGLKDKDDLRAKADRSGSETSGESSPRATKDHSKHSTEHPKSDYIHVRARRGQATDSHSLAERVRREKISERMKFLQDLVPGCSKQVTGKAVMLDEIINYVQSLQRQVEFLSMKLAFVNPRLDFHHETYLGKEGPHPGSQQAMVLGSETSTAYPPLQPQQHQTQLPQGLEQYQLHAESAGRRSMNAMPVVPPPMPRVDSFEDGVRQVHFHRRNSPVLELDRWT